MLCVLAWPFPGLALYFLSAAVKQSVYCSEVPPGPPDVYRGHMACTLRQSVPNILPKQGENQTYHFGLIITDKPKET